MLSRYLRIRIVAFFIVSISFSLSAAANISASRIDRLDERLTDRARQYLKTLHARSGELLPKQVERIDWQAQAFILKGVAKLSSPTALDRKRDFEPADFKMFAKAVCRTGSVRLTDSQVASLRFLGRNFYQPTKWDVAARAASGRRFWEKVHGVLTRHRSGEAPLFTITGPVTANSRAVARTSSGQSFDVKFLLTSVFTGVPASEDEPVRSVQGDDLLAGAPLVVRTIVLRN